MSDWNDPYLQQLLALQAQRQAFQPKAKYPGETDKFLSEQDQFYQSIGYDPLDYALPPQMDVQQYVNESGLPTVTVNGEQAWVGESSARAYYEGAPEDDVYAALALDAMDMIDNGMSPREANRWAQEQVAANPNAFADDPDSVDKVLGDVDKYGADLNTRQSTVDRAIATKGQAADDYGMFEGGGMYSSGLGEDPMGYEKGQAQGSFADYAGVDRAQVAKLLQGQLDATRAEAQAARPAQPSAPVVPGRGSGGGSFDAPPAGDADPFGDPFGYGQGAPLAASTEYNGGGNIADFVLRALGKGPKKSGGLAANMAASKANIASIAGPTEQDVEKAANAQAWKGLFSSDLGTHRKGRAAFQQYSADTAERPNAGHQELIRRVMATRSAMGLEPLPSRPGPKKKLRYEQAQEGSVKKK